MKGETDVRLEHAASLTESIYGTHALSRCDGPLMTTRPVALLVLQIDIARCAPSDIARIRRLRLLHADCGVSAFIAGSCVVYGYAVVCALCEMQRVAPVVLRIDGNHTRSNETVKGGEGSKS